MFSSYHLPPPPIHRLPVELITRIFLLGAALDVRDSPFLLKPADGCYIPPASCFQLHVSHVSHRWRYIALTTPALWTFIRFREPAHLSRAKAYLARCASSPHLLDILVDTVAPSEHIPGITLSIEEFHPIFDIISPHVNRWRALFLKVRDNVCKAGARARLSTCGAAPNLETLQLYHFEDFSSAHELVLATHRPPVTVFENNLPRLRHVSLIGVNLPWGASPYLRNLHQLELALHRETVRPPYEYWERMLRSSPELQKLALHYSGPRVPPWWPSAVPAVGDGGLSQTEEDNWPDGKDNIISLPHLVELSLTDLDPEYLCLLLDHLALPAVTTLALELDHQDYTSFMYKLAGAEEGQASMDWSPWTEHRRVNGNKTGGTEGDGRCKIQPYFPRLECLVLSALDGRFDGWKMLIRSLTNLRVLEVDFRRLGYRDFLYRYLYAAWRFPETQEDEEQKPSLPTLEVLKTTNLSGASLRTLIECREMSGRAQLRWVARWCERWRGQDPIMDSLVEQGWVSKKGGRMRVEAWIDDDYEEAEESESENDEDEDDN